MMIRSRWPARSVIGAIAAALIAGSPWCVGAAEAPNVVLIVSDDQGYADVSFRGSPIETPNIDRIAREGAVLERFYVCPICSPTRAGLMTGRYPIRFGMMRAVVPPWREGGIPDEEVTLPQSLAEAGYRHLGAFGKWHLGHSDARYHPLRRGFTEFYGHYNGAIDYFTHEREGELDWHEGFEVSRDEGYSTDLIAERASRFIREHAEAGPFFCYVPFNAPHAPFQAPEHWRERYDDLDASERRTTYAAMVAAMDKGIGAILEALDESGVADDTLVWFFSDNGGTGSAGSNRPLRGTKQTVFEGGIRVAAAAKWPGVIPAGSTVRAPLAYIDVMPTLLQIAGVEDHGGRPLDGIDALDVLAGRRRDLERVLLVYSGQGGEEDERLAILTPEWKLVVNGPNIAGRSEPGPEHEVLLFDIESDPLERLERSRQHPEVVARLFDRLVAFRELQPPDGMPPYRVGREGFEPPEDWRIPGAPRP